jgi:hypothetical protein
MRQIHRILLALCLAGPSAALAQEFRGTITGQVTDPSGATVPKVTVKARNTGTNVATPTVTNGTGTYSIPFLQPGPYDVSVDATGFKPSTRAVELRVGDRLVVNFSLDVIGVQTSVEVSADSTPLLETASASMGSVVDGRRIRELPLLAGNPMYLAQVAAGLSYVSSNEHSIDPYNTGDPSKLQVGGAPGGVEFTLDGAPNSAVRTTSSSAMGGLSVSFQPSTEAIQEFKVDTASFDAQQGHSSGGNINIVMRSGSNQYHGSGYEFYRPPQLQANDFFLKRSGQEPSTFTYHRFGATLGGPVTLPHLYNGKNKTFFFFAFEGVIYELPSTSLNTVPTAAERQGDFSALLAQKITIYDPASGVAASGGRIQRTAFPVNVIPSNRLNTIGMNVVSYYPLPNTGGSAQGQNNFVGNDVSSNHYKSESFRIDHSLNDNHRFFVRGDHNYNTTASGGAQGWAGVVNGIRPTLKPFYRENEGLSGDYTYVMRPSMVLDVRAGITRYDNANGLVEVGFDPAKLGFSANTLKYFPLTYFPAFVSSAFTRLGNDSTGNFTAANTWYFQPTVNWIHGRHSIKFGWDSRALRQNTIPQQNPDGSYSFDSAYTRGPFDNSTAAPIGQDMAALLLGLPSGGQIDRMSSSANQALYNGFFLHDDFKVGKRLTLNLGLRYEFEGPTTDRFNHNGRGFDLTSPSPIQAAAQAAYAAHPDSSLPASSFHVPGGMLFADSSHRAFWNTDWTNIEPRVGIAFQAARRVVLRGGWGMYMVPYSVDGVQQAGFSQSTPVISSQDGGLTFTGGLANPFPTGVLNPAGASAGLSTYLGQSLTFLPLDRKNARTQRFTVDVQVQLPGALVFEGAYVGSRSKNIPITQTLDTTPAQYLSTSNVRDTNVINFLSAQVANPFAGLLPGTTLNGSTIARSQLLMPYPQYTGLSAETYNGTNRYDSGQFKLERRFSEGFTVAANYTRSRLWMRSTLLNPTDTAPISQLSGDDRPNRFTLSGMWGLPFGKGRHWGNHWGSWVDRAFGGWQLGGLYLFQSGQPLSLGNNYFSGDLGALTASYSTKTVDQPVFTTSGFYFHDASVQTGGVDDPVKQRGDSRIKLSNNIRTLPNYVSGFNGSPITSLDLDLMKTFNFGEKLKVQVRGQSLNTLNFVQFGNPSTDPTKTTFGTVSSQGNYPRILQFGIKILF